MNGIIEITGAFTNSFAINVTAANNGLSKSNPTTVVLGQDFGAVGDPGKILTPREIPLDPGTFIELRAGTIFSTGGQSIIGIANDSTISGQAFGITIVQIGTNDSANIQLVTSDAGSFGPRIQYGGGQASGTSWVTNDNAGIPAAKRNTFFVGAMLSQHNIAISCASRALGKYFSIWGDDGAGSDQEYYRVIPPVSAVLDFPNTNPQLSSDLTVAVPGARDNDSVLLGIPIGAVLPDSCYTAFVSANNVVTIRFNNYSAGAQNPPAAQTFKVGVVRLLP